MNLAVQMVMVLEWMVVMVFVSVMEVVSKRYLLFLIVYLLVVLFVLVANIDLVVVVYLLWCIVVWVVGFLRMLEGLRRIPQYWMEVQVASKRVLVFQKRNECHHQHSRCCNLQCLKTLSFQQCQR